MATNELRTEDASREQTRIRLTNRAGFHLRAATLFAKQAAAFKSDIQVKVGPRHASGKGVMELLTLGAPNGTELEIRAEGPDAPEAILALTELIEGKFGGEP